MNITEKEAGQALEYLSDSDETHAELEYNYKLSEERIKQAKAHAFLLAEGTVAERQAKAEIDPKTKLAIEEWANALKEFKNLTNTRNTQIRITEMFQTLSANRRKGNI